MNNILGSCRKRAQEEGAAGSVQETLAMLTRNASTPKKRRVPAPDDDGQPEAIEEVPTQRVQEPVEAIVMSDDSTQAQSSRERSILAADSAPHLVGGEDLLSDSDSGTPNVNEAAAFISLLRTPKEHGPLAPGGRPQEPQEPQESPGAAAKDAGRLRPIPFDLLSPQKRAHPPPAAAPEVPTPARGTASASDRVNARKMVPGGMCQQYYRLAHQQRTFKRPSLFVVPIPTPASLFTVHADGTGPAASSPSPSGTTRPASRAASTARSAGASPTPRPQPPGRAAAAPR